MNQQENVIKWKTFVEWIVFIEKNINTFYRGKSVNIVAHSKLYNILCVDIIQ